MKPMKFLVPALVLALAAAGCILVSGQFLVDFDLDDFDITTESAVTREDVDLNTNSDYADHKEDLKSIVDMAVLGKLTNSGGTDVNVEVWMTPTATTHATPTDVTSDPNAKLLWGPFKVAAGTTKTVDWNESAKLFSAAGKATLLSEIKGDGQFTIYAIGDIGTYTIDVDNGVLALVLDFGK